MCILRRKFKPSLPNYSGNSGLRTNFSSSGLLRSRMFLSIIVVISLFVDTSNCVRFLGESETFARYPKWNACNNASIMFEFRTTQADGLLMYTNYHGERNSIQVAITEGAIQLRISFVEEKEQNVELILGNNMNNGNWHSIEVKRNRMETTLFVDNSQSSKVAFGDDVGEEMDTNTYMYFGGIPSSIIQNQAEPLIPSKVLNTPFRGEIRNIVYFNCSCIPVRASMLEGLGVNTEPKEACDIRNPCPTGCHCVSGNDGPGCTCDYRQQCLKDILAHYQLPMDSLDRDFVHNPSGLDARVYGNPELVRGIHEMALRLDGRSQWVRVSGPGHKKECFGDLDHCPKGYFIALWIQFQEAPERKAVYMSNGGHLSSGHGIAMSYSRSGLEFIFKTKDGKEWRVEEKDILPGKWYHVAASWAADKGLVLYINGHQVAHQQTSRRTSESRDGGPHKDFVLGRSNDYTGTSQLSPIIVDDFSFISEFKSEEEMREEGPAFHYYLSLDSIQGNKLDAIGCSPRVFGQFKTTPGKIRQGLSFSGLGEYIDLGDASKKCLGDLELCKHGFYMSFFIRFSRLENERSYIFSSPHGMDIYQIGSQLVASAQKNHNIWEARYGNLNPGTWYFVEVSWSQFDGLALYINGQEVSLEVREKFTREPRFTTQMNAFIGRSNEGGQDGKLTNAVIDDVDVYYGTRDMLSSIGYLSTERPNNYIFHLEDKVGNRIVDDRMAISVIGSPSFTAGKIGQALQLKGNSEVADFGDHRSECFGNLDLCHLGVLYAMWLRPDRLRDDTYFMSSGDNGISFSYKGQKLYVKARTSAKQWEVSSSNIAVGKWYFVEVSFHPIHGLSLYINNELEAETTTPAARTDPPSRSAETNSFYLGRGNVDMTAARYAEATYDELEVWYADRDYLIAHGYIQRGRPQHFLIDFEELIDAERLMHPVLSIRLVGGPMLVPGKVNNALALQGRGQYADLGRRGVECFSNLAECSHGITIAAWMRFHRFENNMVFLSTGDNGILMMYKDGYIHVSAGGRSVITTSRFESGRWYFVEVTWHPETGLKLFIDNELRSESGKDAVTSRGQGSFYIGRPNQGDVPSSRYSTGFFDVDEMEIWYGEREHLLAFGYINRDNLGFEAFSMDSANGRRIEHTKYVILLVNGANIVPGRVGNAVSLNGRGQYVDMGAHFDSCFGNLDYCVHGLTMSFWLNPRQLVDGHTFLSTPTYSIFYEDGQLHSVFQGQKSSWTTSTSRLRPDEWQRITTAWHPKKGLTMYINDEVVDQDRQGTEGAPRKKPVSEHVYLGRSLDSDTNTANLMADDLKVWYDDLDQLRSTGQYEVQVVPLNIQFNEFRNNAVKIHDREIRGHGDIQLVQGRGQNTRGIHLLGTSGYLDLGSNFTCGGDLELCRQGVTLRLGLRPVALQDDMVFFDSFPIKLYYKNGRLHGQLQTATQVWTVDTPDFRSGQWQRVELTWQPREGLIMYIDGRKVDYQTYPADQPSRAPSDWRTYFGRGLQGGKSYANTAVDSIEFWPAHRDDLPEDGYLNIPLPATPRPAATPGPAVSSLGRVTEAQTRQAKFINFNGDFYVKFNLENLPAEYLQPAETEEFQFYFLSNQPDGLIWLHEGRNRKMYLALKDGQLIFVNDEGFRAPDEIVFGKNNGIRFNDRKWHLFKINREGRKITLSIDDRFQEKYEFPRDVQFLAPGDVYLGGTENSRASTGNLAVPNFNGGMAWVLYKSQTKQGSRLFTNEVNLIAELGDNITNIHTTDWPVNSFPTKPISPATIPPPQLTAITIRDEGVHLKVPELPVQADSSVSFRFQTIKRDALLMFTNSRTSNRVFLALEIYDGKFYFIYNFGGQSKRVLISETEVSDGQPHEVVLRFSKDLMALHLDGQSRRMRLEAGEDLPQNLVPLYIGGYPAYEDLPWHTWARTGYQGCLEDLQINGRVIDLHQLVQSQLLYERIDRQCTSMPQQCFLKSRCMPGYCINKWGGYYCDCRATDFAGDQCQIPAWTGVFNGSSHYKMTFRPQRKYHVNNISFRFKTMVNDGLIFQTKGRNNDGFIRGEMEGGRMKITTNLGGKTQTFYTGKDLNDMQWHTVYIQRRGNQMTLWVDDQDQETVTLPGDGYHLLVDDIFIGGYRQGELDLPASTKPFIGYLRNFYMGDDDIFQHVGPDNSDIFYQEPKISPLVFNAVTFANYDSHAVLPAIGSASGLSIYFLLKTNDPNGVIVFSEGKNKELFAVELFEGRLHLKFDIPGRPALHMATPENVKYNDGKWHSVFILHENVNGQEQLSMTVDGLHSSYSYSGIDQLNLQGPLYIGGLSEAVFQKPMVRDFLSSKTGYRGCLASVDLGRDIPNLYDYGQTAGILESCHDIISQCTTTTCKNGGVCHDHHNNGTTWCDCSKTAFTGPACEDEPLGYYFRSEGNADQYGMLLYRYPAIEVNDHEVDEIIMGVMTDEKNAVLTKLLSSTFDDFVEIKLVNGFPVVTYDTNSQGASTTITSDVYVSDGKYHIIKFLRTKDKGTLSVDKGVSVNTHSSPHGAFERLNRVYIGGNFGGGKIVDGTGYRGIIGGLYVNGQLIFPYVKENMRTQLYGDVNEAPHPYKLGPLKTPPTIKWDTVATQIPVVTPSTPPPAIIPFLPSDIGGGGIGWEGGAGGSGGGGGSGVNVWVFPEGSAGSSGVVSGGGFPSGEDPVSMAQIAVVPSLPAVGPRAGAVMGTILGLAMFASSLMWAFYRCKPGWCACVKPPEEIPLTISTPRAGSNLAAVAAVSASGAGAGAGAKAGGGLDFVDSGVVAGNVKAGGLTGSAAAAGGGGSGGGYFYSSQASSNANLRNESFDSATLRATGTFSNKGTAIGTPRTARHQFASTSASGFESNTVLTPASLQSYHFEGGHSDPDYDLASGVHPSYQGNTLTVGGGGGGGFSSSTMSSSYNYTVKTIRTVGGQKQMMGYAAGSNSNVIVTPGAMGEEIRVDCCLMTGDGHSVVTGSSLGPPQVWNMSNGELLRIMQGETVGSTNLHLMCNDRLLVGSVNSDLEINQYSVPKGVHNYVFQIWDFSSGHPLGMTDNETCSALTVMSDNDKVVFGRSDKFGGGTNIVVWDLLGNQPIKEMRYDAPVGNNDYISYISLSQNDRYVIAGFTNSFDNFAEFVIFDMTLTSYGISDPHLLRLDANPECTAVLPQDEAVTGLRNGDLVVWSIKTGQPSRQLMSTNGKHAHSREVKAVARSEDSKFLVSASADGTLKLWDLESERNICTMSGHNDEVWCATISSDNEIIVSGSRDGTIRLWQLRNGKEICSFNAGVDVFYITMSHDKETIVALGDKFGARKLIMLQVVRSKVKRQVPA
ncbi:hypothetical protein BsWGS_24934 [Bradybaena similaris]